MSTQDSARQEQQTQITNVRKRALQAQKVQSRSFTS
jgi:hypothetical protein